MQILAADIGGTYARFALVHIGPEGIPRLGHRATFPSGDLEGWREGVERFLAETDERPDRVSMAIAGPVRSGEGAPTNLDWRVRERDVAAMLDAERVRLLNDFEALGHVLPFLEEKDCAVVQEGVPEPSGVRMLLGAGTGLGQALAVPRDGCDLVHVHATEGGHASFAPRTELEWALRTYLSERHRHVSWERVLSGPGLYSIYRFLVDTGRFAETAETRAVMRDVDPAVVVTGQAIQGLDPACVRALDMFVSAYGARAGDLALSAGATGGIYLAGGIAMQLHEELRDRGFMTSFLDKGRMSSWLEKVPVCVIVRPDAGVMGAALAALEPGAREHVKHLPELP